jgi:hypothetical protein
MAFGKAFETRAEANKELRTLKEKHGPAFSQTLAVRKMSKKVHPRRKKLFHVGNEMEFLNFA